MATERTVEVAVSTISLRERWRYRFDNLMARGTPAMIGLLGITAVILILVTSILVAIFASEKVHDDGIARTLWNSLLRTFGPGVMSRDEGSAVFLLLMLVATIGGIMIVASLVGVLNSGLQAKLAELRKGRSRVLEQGHTVVLGWSEQVFTIISELVLANESERRSCVAILAERDKVEMEDEIRSRLGSTGRTSIVCRTGSPSAPADLDIMSLESAKSVIVLSPEVDDPDARVIKSLLAVNSRTWNGHRPHLVAAVTNGRNLPAAQLAGGSHAEVVDSDDIAARLIVQTSRQAGLSVVCSDLLDFEGDEVYMRSEPTLVGAAYGDVLLAYETATVIGLRRGDGGVVLNPPMATGIRRSDEVIVIAEDDSTIQLATSRAPVVATAISTTPPTSPPPERVLLLGWNRLARKVVDQLDQYVAPGSELCIATACPESVPDIEALRHRLRRLSVGHVECDTTDRAALDGLRVGGYDHIIVLADDDPDCERADSRVLVTLLHLRDIEATYGTRSSIVSEMHDERNCRLAQVTKAGDFVVSGKLISLMLTQLSENRYLSGVFGDLFDADGSEIYLKPVEDYVLVGEPVTFATVIAAAAFRGETAIGFRDMTCAEEPPNYGVELNPDKTTFRRFAPPDRIIVLAAE